MEERLKYLTSGTKPRKNKEVMDEVIKSLKEDGLYYGDNKKDASKTEKKKDKKRKNSAVSADSDEEVEKPKKKKKKSD